MTQYSEKKFVASTIEVNYAEGPNNGPPLVLIHGIGGFWRNWEPVIDQLSTDWHVYAVDLRGHGDSGRTPEGYRFIDYPIEIVEFLRNVVDEPAFLVGHSLGAITSSGVCAVTPDLVASAVLEDPPLYVEQTDRFKDVLELRKKNLSLDEYKVEQRKIDDSATEEVVKRRANAIYRVDPDVWVPAIEGGIAAMWDPDAVLAEIKTPVLLMQANPDLGAAISDSEAGRADDLLENGRYVKWNDVGHGMHDAQPERFVQLVNVYFGQVIRKRAQA